MHRYGCDRGTRRIVAKVQKGEWIMNLDGRLKKEPGGKRN
jgi:chaperone required for assembly of F1-ATPase